MKAKICECCGAKIVEYKHSFSHALAIGLYAIYKANKPVNIKNLGLNRNQWDNFQKLRYWNLVSQTYRENGTRANGVWQITQAGKDFIEKATSIKKSVWTYRGNPIRHEGDSCFFVDIHPDGYKQREDYAEEALPHL